MQSLSTSRESKEEAIPSFLHCASAVDVSDARNKGASPLLYSFFCWKRLTGTKGQYMNILHKNQRKDFPHSTQS